MLAARRRHLALLAAVAGPLIVTAILYPLRATLVGAGSALILVLVILLVAGLGVRSAGYLAAVASGFWFDLFLTAPYLKLAISSRADVQTDVALILVGVVITEIVLWGRRQQAANNQREGYLSGVLDALDPAMVAGSDLPELTRRVDRELVALLDLDDCRYVDEPDRSLPVLGRDGSITRRGTRLSDRGGLPTDTAIALPVTVGETTRGAFLLTASAHVARPTVEQRRVAVALAEQVGRLRAGEPGRRLG